jgi:hypothetical protein
MINVNQITARLAKMPDAALQQYASLHKNDPYTVSLAMSESNRRKDMRTSAQPQPGQQPTVVDQGIAQMGAQPQAPQMPQGQGMPENMGIGTLPQQPMPMAEGGIVAFADGGDIQNFAGGGSSLVRSTSGGKDWFLDIPDTIRDPSVPYYQQIPNPAAVLGDKKYGSREEAAAAYDSLMGTAAPITPSALAAQSQSQSAPSSNADRGNFPGQGSTGMATPAPTQAPAASPASVSPLAALSMSQQTSSPMGGGAPAGLSFMEQLKKTRAAQGPAEDPEAGARGELSDARVASSEKTKAELDADIESQAGMFDKREARQNERGEALEKSKETNKGLAFLEAGLAMMQSRGPGLAAIAQGAGVGVKQYSAGLKDLKEAQRLLDDARDKTDELKQTQSSMNKKEQRAASKDIRETTLAGQAAEIDARMKLANQSRQEAIAATGSDINTANERAKLASSERIAANALTRAAMTDNRSDERARLAAASTLLKESGDMLNGPMSLQLSADDRKTYLADYNAAKAVLNSLGGITGASAADRADYLKYK